MENGFLPQVCFLLLFYGDISWGVGDQNTKLNEFDFAISFSEPGANLFNWSA